MRTVCGAGSTPARPARDERRSSRTPPVARASASTTPRRSAGAGPSHSDPLRGTRNVTRNREDTINGQAGAVHPRAGVAATPDYAVHRGSRVWTSTTLAASSMHSDRRRGCRLPTLRFDAQRGLVRREGADDRDLVSSAACVGRRWLIRGTARSLVPGGAVRRGSRVAPPRSRVGPQTRGRDAQRAPRPAAARLLR